MKKTQTVKISIESIIAYLKRGGKVHDTYTLKEARLLKTAPILVLSFNIQSPLKKVLSETVMKFLDSRGASTRVRNSIFHGFFSRVTSEKFPKLKSRGRDWFKKRDKLKSRMTVEDFLQFDQEFLLGCINFGKTSLDELLQLLLKEKIPTTYPLFRKK